MTDLLPAPATDTDDLGHPLAGVPAPGPWVLRGRCRTAPPALFFPERGDDLRQARAICKGCPVVDECAAYAIPHRDLRGIWGGLSDQVAGPAASEAGALYGVLEQLAHHPGHWAKVGHYRSTGSAHTMASLLRTGRKPLPAGHWTFEGRRNPAGGSDLYARSEASDGGGKQTFRREAE